MPEIPKRKKTKIVKSASSVMTMREYADRLDRVRLEIAGLGDRLMFLSGEVLQLHSLLYTEPLQGPIVQDGNDIPF